MTDKAWRGPDAIPGNAPCPTRIYEIWGADPWERGIGNVPLWIGETSRFALDRISEHFRDKYWRHDIREIRVNPTVYPSKAAAWRDEERLTHELQPLYPVEYNQRNPWRIQDGRGVCRRLPRIPESWDFNPAVRQRGVPRQYPPQRTPKPDVEAYLAQRARRKWLAALWVLLVAGCSYLLRDRYDGADLLWSGVVSASLLMIGGWLAWRRYATPQPRRARARSVRR